MNEATRAFLSIAIAKKENHYCDHDYCESVLGSGSTSFLLPSFEPRGLGCFFFVVSVQQTFHLKKIRMTDVKHVSFSSVSQEVGSF